MSTSAVKQALRAAADPKRAVELARFFKTGKGEYGAGDVFIGITVPQLRAIAARHRYLSLSGVQFFLRSRIHEERLVALLILVDQFERATPTQRARICTFYLKHLQRVNNWDLVDLSAPKILGAHLLETARRRGERRSVLLKLADSPNLWERRIAIVSTLTFIRAGHFTETLALCKKLLYDTHDLIHKAMGWMLREIGKCDKKILKQFFKQHAAMMPRTTLRYAIERFPSAERRRYLEQT